MKNCVSMPLKHHELLRCCRQILDTFDPDDDSIECHLHNYLLEAKDLDDAEKTFVEEVFSGSIRFSGILKVVTDGYFVRDGKSVLRSEVHLYTVIGYVMLFRLQELGIEEFHKFIKSQDVNKMYRFLRFATDEHNLTTWMMDLWHRLYDIDFVKENVLSPVQSALPELHKIVGQLKSKVDNKLLPKKQAMPNTEIQPFNLTKPKPTGVPMPQEIPTMKKVRALPVTTYEQPVEQLLLAEKREANKKEAEERLVQSTKERFACTNPAKSRKAQLRMKKLEEERDAELQFNVSNYNPPPAHTARNVPIKLNAAAILREGILYQKREAVELNKIAHLEAGNRDPGEFLAWQAAMRQQDADARKADLEKRRVAGLISYEDAILAKQNMAVTNRQKALEMKQQADKYMQLYLEDRLRGEEMARKRVEEVISTHANCREARKKLHAYKAKIVQAMTEESRQLMKQALEEAEAEMEQKMQLIEQIRAMHAIPLTYKKLVDFTETSGYHLLGEMSIAELRERLALMKETQAEEDEEKRDSIIAAKEAKDERLMDTLWQISRHRAVNSQTATIKQEQKCQAKASVPVEDSELSELQRILMEKKTQRLEERATTRTAKKPSTMNVATDVARKKREMEIKRWEHLDRRQERLTRIALGEATPRAKRAATAN